MKNQLAYHYARLLLVACGLAFSSSQSFAAESAEAATSSDPFAAFEAVSEQHLATMRGRAGNLTIVSSNQDFKSTVQGSQFNAGAINTGRATVGKQAFEAASGAFVTVVNTGNANAFNTGMNITINLH